MLCACVVLMCIRHTHVTIVRYFSSSSLLFDKTSYRCVATLCIHNTHIRTNKQTNNGTKNGEEEEVKYKKTHINTHSSLARHFRSSSKAI